MRKYVFVGMMYGAMLGACPAYAKEEFHEEEGYHEERAFDFFRWKTSLGQLCKTSDIIIVGKLKGRKLTGKKMSICAETAYTFQVERVLDGNTSARTIIVHGFEDGLDEFTLYELKTNSTCVVFCSHKEGYPLSDKSDFDLLSLSFEKAKLPWRVSKWLITMNDRGVIQVDGETAEAYEQAIKGHLEHIRSKDVLGYFDFLRGLSKSGIERIRRDALEDVRSLTRYSASEDNLEKILGYPDLTGEEKAVVQESLDIQRAWKRRVEEAKKEQEHGEKPPEREPPRILLSPIRGGRQKE